MLNNHKTDQSNDIDQILTVMELVNKEALKSGIGGGLHGQAEKMLQGVNLVEGQR